LSHPAPGDLETAVECRPRPRQWAHFPQLHRWGKCGRFKPGMTDTNASACQQCSDDGTGRCREVQDADHKLGSYRDDFGFRFIISLASAPPHTTRAAAPTGQTAAKAAMGKDAKSAGQADPLMRTVNTV
jgi:hypothetical protein